MKRIFFLLSSLILFAAFTHGQQTKLVLGDPSPTDDEVVSTDNNKSVTQPSGNLRVSHKTFVLSFNPRRLAADWVAWHTQSSDLGTVKRSNDFRPDPKLPKQYQVGSATFGSPLGAQLDRGHLCPSGDRTRTKEMNSETYLMSNMQPQHKDLNQKTWKDFEDYVRGAVRTGLEAYQYAGCSGGEAKIPKNGMTIPTHCWKIVLFVKKGKDDLQRIASQNDAERVRVIAIDMPNDGSTKGEQWSRYRTSVAAIEQRTGFRFFSTLPNDVSNSLKSMVDSEFVPLPTPNKPKSKKRPANRRR